MPHRQRLQFTPAVSECRDFRERTDQIVPLKIVGSIDQPIDRFTKLASHH